MEAACKERTLVRNNELLAEFDSGDAPGLQALYYHFRDRAFDCFDAAEYTNQMLAYYKAGYAVKLVVPRKISENGYVLVCLQSQKQPEKDSLCELAFQCARQFVGISMLVKKRCFVCNQPAAKTCSACQCACFCSKECQASGWLSHRKLCALIKASSAVVERECVQLNTP
jgi:hypothetical protein